MTREETKRRAEIMLAAEYDGDVCVNIEGKVRTSGFPQWHKKRTPNWDWGSYDYRAIPKPKIIYFELFEGGGSISDKNLDKLKPFDSDNIGVLKITIVDGKPSAEFIDMESVE